MPLPMVSGRCYSMCFLQRPFSIITVISSWRQSWITLITVNPTPLYLRWSQALPVRWQILPSTWLLTLSLVRGVFHLILSWTTWINSQHSWNQDPRSQIRSGHQKTTVHTSHPQVKQARNSKRQMFCPTISGNFAQIRSLANCQVNGNSILYNEIKNVG